jgi:hypothetical protein
VVQYQGWLACVCRRGKTVIQIFDLVSFQCLSEWRAPTDNSLLEAMDDSFIYFLNCKSFSVFSHSGTFVKSVQTRSPSRKLVSLENHVVFVHRETRNVNVYDKKNWRKICEWPIQTLSLHGRNTYSHYIKDVFVFQDMIVFWDYYYKLQFCSWKGKILFENRIDGCMYFAVDDFFMIGVKVIHRNYVEFVTLFC